jgi:hypothetical protein
VVFPTETKGDPFSLGRKHHPGLKLSPRVVFLPETKEDPFSLGWKHHPGLKYGANFFYRKIAIRSPFWSRLISPTGTKG